MIQLIAFYHDNKIYSLELPSILRGIEIELENITKLKARKRIISAPLALEEELLNPVELVIGQAISDGDDKIVVQVNQMAVKKGEIYYRG